MAKRINVSSREEAEAAIAAGNDINIAAGNFTLAVAASISIWISGTSAPSIVTRDTSAPRIETRGTSAPSIETWDTSAPSIETRDTSAPSIETRETSAPRIETWDTSAPSIETRGASAPRIAANGYSYIYARGGLLVGTATANVIVRHQGPISVEGGMQFEIRLEGPRDWCEFYGALIEGDEVRVYKATGANYISQWGADYKPGTMPEDAAWNGRGEECAKGGGLNFSPTPRHTQEFVSAPAHYLECWVKLDEMVCHFDGSYPQKICAPRVSRPIIECDVDGNRIGEAA